MNEVEGLLQIEQVPIIGLLLAAIAVLIYVITSLRKDIKEKDIEINALYEQRLTEQKEFNKDMLSISNKVSHYISQLQDILKIKQDV